MMKKMMLIGVMVLCAGVAFAVTQEESSRSLEAEIVKTSITGTVVDENTGDGIAYADVVLDETGATAVTDENGQFAFSELEPGEYSVTAYAEGYAEGTETVEVTEEGGYIEISLTPELPETN